MFSLVGVGLIFAYGLRVFARQHDAPILKINEFDKDLIKADKRIGIVGLSMFFGGLGFLLLGWYVGY